MTDRVLPLGSTLLIDLDGVVAEQLPQLCAYLAREYDHDVDPADIVEWSYDVPGAEGHIGDIIGELMSEHAEWYFGEMEPRTGAVAALSALGDEYRIEIATHRTPETHDVSKAWLAEHEIEYDTFHDAVPRNKGSLSGDALIDDYHGNIADAIAADKVGVLMRQPYSDPTACDGAYVVESWRDVRALFCV